jgi:hypothetical protein
LVINQYYGLYKRGVLSYYNFMKFPYLLNRLTDDDREKLYIFLLVVGAIIFYLPFLSKQFIGDDWLWLANAKKALTDPSIFIGRPMYGYFRPLNMVAIFLMEYMFGPNAKIFSLLSIFLHAANVFLLWKVLKEFDVQRDIRLLSAFIFAFYYLNCAAIEWISVGHDLWVTGLMLIYLLRLKIFYEESTSKTFITMFAVGWAAALFKESGLVAIGFYFIYFLLLKANPFSRKYRAYSLLNILSYLIFCIIYFKTRTVADKQIEFGINTGINIWYFLVYLILPFARVVVANLARYYQTVLEYIKILVTILIPVLLAVVYMKGTRIAKLLVLWPIFFLSTIAVFKWGVSLFMLYPIDPASRFMYSPFVGMAVCIAWFGVLMINQIVKSNLKPFVYAAIGMLFIAANYFIVSKSSSLYTKQQDLSQSVIDDIQANWEYFENADTVVVVTNDLANTEQIIASGEHLPAILLVKFDIRVSVIALNIGENMAPMLGLRERKLIVGWNEQANHMVFPEFESTK